METTSTEVSTKSEVDTKRDPRAAKRRQWSEALKRRIVAETQEPGSSVSVVARRHDVNTNQVFKWRREMAPKQMPAPSESVTMLPVAIVSEPRERPARLRRSGVIEVAFACGTRVTVRGDVSSETLRQVIELLR